jgi:hypothetical protein
LIRASIYLQKMMDCRVKPGNDRAVVNSPNARADILNPERYINTARHVRAFGVGLDRLE